MEKTQHTNTTGTTRMFTSLEINARAYTQRTTWSSFYNYARGGRCLKWRGMWLLNWSGRAWVDRLLFTLGFSFFLSVLTVLLLCVFSLPYFTLTFLFPPFKRGNGFRFPLSKS